jgi:hypothetical protein
LIIDEIIGKVNPMKTEGKIVNPFEIFACTAIAQKVILDFIHLHFPPNKKTAV